MKTAIYLPNHLGDAIVASSLITWFKESFPNDKLIIIIRDNLQPLFSNHPDIFKIYSVKKGLKNQFKQSKILKIENIDLCFILTKSISAALLTYFAQIKKRVGYSVDNRGIFLTDIIKQYDYHNEPLRNYYFRIVEKYFSKNPPLNIDFYCPEVDKKTNTLSLKLKDMVAIDPGALYGDTKIWGDKNWIDLIKIIEKKEKVVLFGIRDLSSWEKEFKNTINLSNKVQLRDLPCLLKNLKVFISGDTGSMHLASALGVNTISLFGSSYPKWTAPWGKGEHRIIYKPPDCSPCFKKKCKKKNNICMKNITIHDILKEYEYIK